ncbi:hypothetical protein [Staphylococcus caprae]|uniref:hypothetical protein n=1 Tax=Staphylococcus caprae TaxID=29380 RepID=UPI000CD25456|nr:hypothetical protein [Staphylococcus caprae]POA05612.1 hypothetical protein CD155_04440 [Staphylococcus caprae]SUL95995.1 Uncharacterised protein [Staphylococcus caprae]
MAYEHVNKLKSYLNRKLNALVTGEKVKFNINVNSLKNELGQLETKAEAFDVIADVFEDGELYTDADVLDIISRTN